eukprot:gene8079-9597_t
MGQSMAIANVLARQAPALAGETDKDYVMSQMLLAEAEDIYGLLVKLCPTIMKDKRDGVTQLWSEDVPAHLAKLEALLEGPGPRFAFTFTGLTVGELYLWGVLYQMTLVKPEVLSNTPKINAWYSFVHQHPGVQKTLEGKAGVGTLGQYFIA